MARVRENVKRVFRKFTGRRPKQPVIPLTALSRNITPEGPSATDGQHSQEGSRDSFRPASSIPPTVSSAITMPEGPSATARHSSAASPVPPVVPSTNITLEDPSAAGSNHIQHEQSRDSFPTTFPAAKSFWDRAYDALAQENPKLVEEYDALLAKEEPIANSAPSGTTPLQLPVPHGLGTRSDRSPRQVQLETVIQNGLQRMEDNKLTYNIAGHEFVLADQITQVSKFLLWGKEFIGSAVKSSPEASIVWSGVSLIFPLLTNPTTADEANRDGFSYVTSRMRYYVALEPLLRRLAHNARVDGALISVANEHIVDLYQAILEFQLSSVLRFYQSRIRTYVHDIVPLKDWEQTRLDIEKLEGTVNNDLSQINGLVARQELELLNETSERTRETMENNLSVATQQLAVLSEQLTVSKQQKAAQEDARQENLLAKQQAEHEKLLAKQQKCLQELYLTQNGKSTAYDWYKGRVERRVEGTCMWFLQHENYQKWLSQESGPLLVSADPGCGKSVLAKYLIDHGLAQQSTTICYFFFKDQDQNTICQALCALLHQMFSHKLALIQHAMELYDKKGDKLVQSEESLWKILRDVVRDPQAGPVIFVIDALDECAESELKEFVTNLKDFFYDPQLENVKFKLLMTSRPYEQVLSKFYSLQDEFPHIHIPGEEEFETISQEINSVIHYRVGQLAEELRLSDKIKSSLTNKLLAIDHRTYLWVYLVFDYLENKGFKKTDDGIDAAIQTLPNSVNQAYDQILNRSQDDDTVKTVKKVLSIILAAHRPLTLSEMNIAMSLDDQGRGRSIYDLDLEPDVDFKTRLRKLCGLFVNIHHDKIYFLHQTAREFLIQSSAPTTVSADLQWHRSITIRHAHSVLAEICILYLDMVNSTHTKQFRQNDHHGALLDYSVEHWGDHCREAKFEKDSAMVDLATGLCTPDLTSHSQWASITFSRYHIRPWSFTNVLVASQLGLTHVTELLLSRGADIEARTSQGRTALMLAAGSGHKAVTQLLLENGASIKAMDDGGMTALMLAAAAGHEAVTQLLLENGADVDAEHDEGGTALMFAVLFGGESVVRLLIEYGTDVNSGDLRGRTALMLAAGSRHKAVTQLLLENGANVDAKNNDGRTALMRAAEYGREADMRLLLENGANVNAKKDDGRTALMYAARYGHEAATRMLLKNGADVEAKNDDGETALALAYQTGSGSVARLLIENGADVKPWHLDDTTALYLAAASGEESHIRLLLENGADIEAKDDDGSTALMRAAKNGHEAAMRLLLENGADVKARTSGGRTVLMLAAEFCHKAVTQLLLDNGADIEARDDDSWTVLMRAARGDHEALFQLLIDKRVNFESGHLDDTTASMLTAVNDEVSYIRLLLENGADVKATTSGGRTVLMIAAASGYEAVIRLLFEIGTDVEAKDNDGSTALSLATENGHKAVTQLLLENGAIVEAEDVNEE